MRGVWLEKRLEENPRAPLFGLAAGCFGVAGIDRGTLIAMSLALAFFGVLGGGVVGVWGVGCFGGWGLTGESGNCQGNVRANNLPCQVGRGCGVRVWEAIDRAVIGNLYFNAKKKKGGKGIGQKGVKWSLVLNRGFAMTALSIWVVQVLCHVRAGFTAERRW